MPSSAAASLLVALALGWSFGVDPADAQPGTLSLSPDVMVDLSGRIIDDRYVGRDDLAGMVQLFQVGQPGFPSPFADVVAFHSLPGGGQLFVLDVTQTMPGMTVSTGTVTAGGLIQYNGGAYSLAFDPSLLGAGIHVDAVSMSGSDLLLSFDTTVLVSGITAGDEDLLRFDSSSFSLEFDGSAEGIAPGLDLDAAHLDEATGELYLSFDGSGAVGGVTFDDEDVLAFDPSGGTWQMAYDGSAEHAGWAGGDLDALFIESAGPPAGWIFADDFESGSTGAWSGVAP